MARYRVLETSFINNSRVQEGAVVDINDDPANGGMTPGSALARVDEDDELEAAKPARRAKKPTVVDDTELA